MVEQESYGALGLAALTRLLSFSDRELHHELRKAATPGETALVALRLQGASPSPIIRIIGKLNADAAQSDYTSAEQRVIGAVRRHGEVRDEITEIRRAFSAQLRVWLNDNAELIQTGFRQAIEDHLGAQTAAIMRLTDQEISRIRQMVSSDAASLTRHFSVRLLQNTQIPVEDDTEALMESLVTAAVPSLETLRMRVSVLSKRQLTISERVITTTFLPDRSTLRPLVEKLQRIRVLEGALPEIEEEEEAAVADLEASVSRSRWDAAEPIA